MQSDDLDGVFGKTSGTTLKRLPSSVYWSGLEKWGIKSKIVCKLNISFMLRN
jgi:hypothetical protein